VLGFTNQWYELAIATAVERTLTSGEVIRAANPPAIVATKLAAWRGRGRGDVLASLDLHDVIALIDGRPEFSGELRGPHRLGGVRRLRAACAAERAPL
jgi:predicted nucleotidyltransferase